MSEHLDRAARAQWPNAMRAPDTYTTEGRAKAARGQARTVLDGFLSEATDDECESLTWALAEKMNANAQQHGFEDTFEDSEEQFLFAAEAAINGLRELAGLPPMATSVFDGPATEQQP